MLSPQIFNNSQIFILNNIIKLDPTQISNIYKLKSSKQENYSFNDTDKLWYFQNYKKKTRLIDIIYPDEKIIKIEFTNNDFNDYRESNLILTKNNKFKNEFKSPENLEIIDEGSSIKILEGKYAGQYRNMYWEIKSKENYMVMHVKDDIYTKFSKKDLKKVFNISDKRPVWYLHENGYIATTLRIGQETYFYYLHQLILDQHDQDNTDMKNTVDHINQDKLDNRRENLRIINMSEQNKNKGKQTRRIDAKTELPDGIKTLPKYIEYRKEIYDKENNKQREFFIVNHPKLDKTWETTKSNKVLAIDKLKFAKAKIELLEGKLTETQFKQIIGLEDKMDLPTGIRLELFREKYHFIFDLKKEDQRYNAKMILHSTDVQKELDKFIEKVVNDKYPNYMKKYVIENPIEIDEQLVSLVEKKVYIKSPTYPQYITVYEEKDSKYIQYNRTIKGIRYNKKNKILSNDIQKELDKLVKDINEKYTEFNLDKQIIMNPEYFVNILTKN